jgi:hypothetical protein
VAILSEHHLSLSLQRHAGHAQALCQYARSRAFSPVRYASNLFNVLFSVLSALYCDYRVHAANSLAFVLVCNRPPNSTTGSGWHDITFAGYQYEYAVKTREQFSANGFDPVSYSLGFGSGHLCGDMVGHHSNGYLTPQWDHPLEVSVDTLTYKVRSSCSTAVDTILSNLISGSPMFHWAPFYDQIRINVS